MKPAAEGYRVAVVGASSLLGKELLAVLKERGFPVSRLVTLDDAEAEPSLPVVDLREGYECVAAEEEITETDLDFVFLAERPRAAGLEREQTAFLESAKRLAGATQTIVIDLGGYLAGEQGGALRVPFIERGASPNGARGGKTARAGSALAPRFFISAHPATIVLSGLLLRLAASCALKAPVAQVLGSASEIGPRAIEELQKQTVSLLSFQKIPKTVFGAQLAFNLLARLGHCRSPRTALHEIRKRIQEELRVYLGERAPLPALRFFQAPVFHSLTLSLYVETAEPVGLQSLTRALEGGPIHVRQSSEQAPSPVEAAGSGDILVDALVADPCHPFGIWIWAAADNLRLAAVNAVEIAESLHAQVKRTPSAG